MRDPPRPPPGPCRSASARRPAHLARAELQLRDLRLPRHHADDPGIARRAVYVRGGGALLGKVRDPPRRYAGPPREAPGALPSRKPGGPPSTSFAAGGGHDEARNPP